MTRDQIDKILLINQDVWDKRPDRADDAVCEAIVHGGFSDDWIRRRVSNYEGQIMAIQRGLVDQTSDWLWRINDKGIEFLRDSKKHIPHFLPVIDGWHDEPAEYCMFEVNYRGRPALKFAKDMIPQGAHLCMHPHFCEGEARALRDYITNWLARCKH